MCYIPILDDFYIYDMSNNDMSYDDIFGIIVLKDRYANVFY